MPPATSRPETAIITNTRMRTEPPTHPAVAASPPAAVGVRSLPAGAETRKPWWLWPHLLSLDAPLVALAWQDWWSRSEGTPLPGSRRLILGLGVWMIYLADRLSDARRHREDDGVGDGQARRRTGRSALLRRAQDAG